MWKMIFQDEFDGPDLNTEKWDPIWPFNPPLNNSIQNYETSNVVLTDGKLRLIGERRSSGGQPYTAGAVHSKGRFEFKYGVVELRMKAPAGKGLWSAAWMLYPNGPWPPEIDITEILGTLPTVNFMTYHYGTASDMRSSSIPALQGIDFTTDYHIYSVHWTHDRITWYVDGVARGSFADATNIADQPMVLLLNLKIGGNAGGFGPGVPDASTPFPNELSIDYVRVWQQDQSTP